MRALLSANVAGYISSEVIVSDTSEEGSLRMIRQYYEGETSLRIRVSVPSAPTELKTQIRKLMTMFSEMMSEGRMEAENLESTKAYGVLTFAEGTGGIIALINDKYLVEAQLSGVTSVQQAKNVFEKLDFSLLQ